jgi:gliding motility-associated-like protein
MFLKFNRLHSAMRQGKWACLIFMVLSGILSALPRHAYANHLFGGELFYTHVGGNTYQVTMILYGDCGNTTGSFASLPAAQPTVEVYNGSAFVQMLTLTGQPGSGVDVSPVCPDEANNTKCVNINNPLPGVKKFIYAASITLNGTSANWRFRSTGNLGNSSAGRSTAITNIIVPVAGSLMSLEATLNNTAAANSSPVYTTIPTPFFCINKPQEYNQGAVDGNGDSLSFQLVPGLNATNPSTNVTYIAPATATAPLLCLPGSYSFNTTNGQLSFYPNAVQNALVVSKVSEYRNGVLVGTSMREMTFVVLNNCNNNPPDGSISNPVNGTLVNNTTIKTCVGNTTLSFNIPVADPDGDNITIDVQGVPSGPVTFVQNNNTASPNFVFSWNLTGVAPGSYTFYLTFTDDGCPLTSKQTVAYTVQVLPKPGIVFSLVEPATCSRKAKFTIAPVGNDFPYTFNALQGSTTLLTVNNITGTVTDSLPGGSYTFRIAGANGCFKDTLINFPVVVDITPQVTWTQPFCPNGNTGTITVGATGASPPFQYAVSALPYSTVTTYAGLSAGTHIVHIKDAQGCTKDTSITITNPPAMYLGLSITKPVCSPVSNGQIGITPVNGTAPYQYALNAGPYGTAGMFSGLGPGSYTLHVKDAHDCIRDTTITLTDSLTMLLTATVTPALCFGSAGGSVTLTASGTTSPYSYAIGTGPYGTSNTFTNLAAGTYVFHIKDLNQCLKDTSIAISQPPPLAFNLDITHVPCYGTNGGVVTVNAGGGTPAYQYAADLNPFQAANVLTGLNAGMHTIQLKDNNGCTKDTSITLVQPASAIAFGPVAIINPTCEGFADGQVTLAATGGTSPYTYRKGGNGFSSQPAFTQLTEGAYTFTIRDNNGCTKDTVITLTGFPHIIIDSVQMVRPSCNGGSDGSMTIAASEGTPPFSYRLGQAGNWGGSNVFGGQKAGKYQLQVKDANQCIKDTFVVLEQPEQLVLDTLTVGNDCNGIDDGGLIEVIAKGGTPPYAYLWKHDASLHGGRITGLVNGRYQVVVTDAHLCADSLTVDILYNNCCTPFIPNAFTPNGDGRNDVYKVEYKGDMDLKEMYIYNRYGQRVFSSANVGKVWDGTFDGKVVDAGTYFYYIRILCGNVKKRELVFKGDVTLVR